MIRVPRGVYSSSEMAPLRGFSISCSRACRPWSARRHGRAQHRRAEGAESLRLGPWPKLSRPESQHRISGRCLTTGSESRAFNRRACRVAQRDKANHERDHEERGRSLRNRMTGLLFSPEGCLLRLVDSQGRPATEWSLWRARWREEPVSGAGDVEFERLVTCPALGVDIVHTTASRVLYVCVLVA